LKALVIVASLTGMIGAALGLIFLPVNDRARDSAAAAWASVYAGGLILLAVLGRPRTVVGGLLAAAACVGLLLSAAAFWVMAAHPTPDTWSYLTMAILFMGGLVAAAVSVEKPLPRKTALEQLSADQVRIESAATALEHSAPEAVSKQDGQD
jgi:hypothetical protein